MNVLEFLSQLAPILSFITIVTAVIFGLLQLRQFKVQRKDLAAVEIMRSIQDKQFTDSYSVLSDFDQEQDINMVIQQDQDLKMAVLALSTKFETLGFLVYKRVIPISFVEELVGGVCIHVWQRIAPYAQAHREEMGQDIFLEWFEWLAYQFKHSKRDQSQSALDRFKNWKS